MAAGPGRNLCESRQGIAADRIERDRVGYAETCAAEGIGHVQPAAVEIAALGAADLE